MAQRPTLRRRAAGVLLHPTSLPGPHGIGDLGPQAHAFAEWLARAGQSWWQMLPVAPLGVGDSPYSGLSAFAGSRLLISLERLRDEGLLEDSDLAPARDLRSGRVEFVAARRFKAPRLRKAFDAFERRRGSDDYARFDAFCGENASWLADYSLFCAIRASLGGAPWPDWEPALRRREPEAVTRAWEALGGEARFEQFVQYQFQRQWDALRRRCRELGIGLIGDVPIYVALDSAEVWDHADLFHLDAEGRPTAVAGVPPDFFSRTGQLWGNPLYRWEVLRERGYGWWLERLRTTFSRFDAARLDHFIGFTRYYEVPASAETAEHGRWLDGPGHHFFEAVRAALGAAPEFIAEDLGAMTPEVHALRERFEFPGIRVLQFAFRDGDEGRYFQPHRYPARCVVYPGTHDNDTARGWIQDKGGGHGVRAAETIARERARALAYLGCGVRDFHWALIRAAWASVADTAVVQAQDLLGLGSQARMNRPGTVEGNWRWRLKAGALTRDLAARLRELTDSCERVNG